MGSGKEARAVPLKFEPGNQNVVWSGKMSKDTLASEHRRGEGPPFYRVDCCRVRRTPRAGWRGLPQGGQAAKLREAELLPPAGRHFPLANDGLHSQVVGPAKVGRKGKGKK